MTIFYAIGPSGAGKSSLCRSLAEADTSLVYIDLDDEAKKRAKFDSVRLMLESLRDRVFWLYCQAIFEDLEKKALNQDYLVDVGAGTLEARESWTYFKEHKQQVLCIWGTPEAVFERKYKQKGWTLERLIQIEYAPKRTELYRAMPFKVDSSNQTPDVSLIRCQATLADLRSRL